MNKILVVDDEKETCLNIKEFLLGKDFFAEQAYNGEEALEKCSEFNPDVVLLDVKMPKMDGIEALKQIKDKFPETEIIMTTAVDDLETAISCMQMGAFGYQIKPVNLEGIYFEIGRALEHRRLIIENKDYQTNLERKVEEKTKELSLKNLELQKLDELKSKFMACVSHELRTPLMQIDSGMQVLKMVLKEKVTESEDKLLRIIDCGTGRLNSVVLNMAKTLQGEFKDGLLEKETICLNDFVKEVYKEISYFAGLRKQTIQIQLPKEEVNFEGDKGKLNDVLVNIGMNAVKFTPDGGEIIVGLETNGNVIRLIVKDNGIGLTEEDKLHIFKKFYEAGDMMYHSTGTFEFKAGGLGLGLSIAKIFTEMHDGTIKVESEGKGKGSAFIVEFTG